MISPEFLMHHAQSKGVWYMYDADHDGKVDLRDVDRIAQSQSIIPKDTHENNNPFQFK